MSIFVPWLADAARLTGYPVAEVSGWRSRGHGGMTAVEGVVCHHTAGPKTGEYPSLQVVRDGRSDLPGPLANFGLGRSGTVYVIAAGLAYHAGTSEWAGFSDLNYRFLGIEAEDDGDGIWTAAQLDCYPRLCAALCYYMRRDASRVCAHRECALPKGRKPDPTGIDMPAFRARVADLLGDPLHRIPAGSLEDDMPTAREVADAILDTPIARQGEVPPWVAPPGQETTTTLRNEVAWMTSLNWLTVQKPLTALHDAVAAIGTPDVDSAAIAQQVAAAVTAAGIAGPVADELAARLGRAS